MDPYDGIYHFARAYLLYILDITLFADKTGMRVSFIYLQLLTDLDRVDTFAWSAAALAYLYRQLGLVTWVFVKQIASYLTLLEAWIYEHFLQFKLTSNTGLLPR